MSRILHAVLSGLIVTTMSCTAEGEPPSASSQDSTIVTAAATDPCGPELYHDSQRVANKKDDEYGGGLMCAVPVAVLGALDYNSYTGAVPLPVAFVQVHTDAGTYTDDYYKLGRNCIYIGSKQGQSVPNTTSKLEAYIDSVATPVSGDACPPMSPNAKKVNIRSHKKYPNDIPAVLRLDQKRSNREIILGLRCLPDEWCEIAKSAAGNQAKPDAAHKTKRIPGYYDEQYLAVPNGADLKPSLLFASIFPVDTLEDVVRNGEYKSWKRVAVIVLDGTDSNALATYTKNWGLEALPGGLQDKDTVYLDLKWKVPGDQKKFVARYAARNVIGTRRKVDYHEDGTKETQFFNANGFETPLGVTATRWGWAPVDETAWVRCLQGCCGVANVEDK